MVQVWTASVIRYCVFFVDVVVVYFVWCGALCYGCYSKLSPVLFSIGLLQLTKRKYFLSNCHSGLLAVLSFQVVAKL